MIAFKCPKCRSALEFADDAAGRIVRCPECQVKLRLPGELPPEDESERARPRRKKRRRRQEVEETTEVLKVPRSMPT